MNSGRKLILNLNAALLFGLVGLACSSQPTFVVQDFTIEQQSWDSLFVSAVFRSQPTFGNLTIVTPDIVAYTVFNTRFDTLYVGDSSRIPLQDKVLSDREQLLVEVCGVYKQASACEQRVVMASPKKVSANFAVNFPLDAPVNDRGELELASSLHRQIFGTQEWELIRKPSGKDLSVKVYAEKAPKDHIRIPISRSSTPFELNRYDGHRDLRFNIQSSLMDSDSAAVVFELEALFDDSPSLVEQRRIVLRSKSELERMSEIKDLVERAGEVILSEVSGRFGTRRAYVFINTWSFEALNRAYLAEFEIHWQDTFRSEWSDLSGKLHVRSDGTEGTFVFLRGSERAEDKWNREIGKDYLELDPLLPEKRTRDGESGAESSRFPNSSRRNPRGNN